MGLNRVQQKQRIKRRVRKVAFGSPESPRLAVYRSNKEIYAQLIDDTKGITLVSASSKDKDFEGKGNRKEIAFEVGKKVGKKAVEAGVSYVCFDRGTVLYHGRVKSLAEGAREAGLKF